MYFYRISQIVILEKINMSCLAARSWIVGAFYPAYMYHVMRLYLEIPCVFGNHVWRAAVEILGRIEGD